MSYTSRQKDDSALKACVTAKHGKQPYQEVGFTWAQYPVGEATWKLLLAAEKKSYAAL